MTFAQKMKLVFSGIWDFVGPFVAMLLKQGGALLLTVAVDAVRNVSVSMPNASGSEKRDAAFNIIKGQMKEKGCDVATSVINSAIEVAVQKLS